LLTYVKVFGNMTFLARLAQAKTYLSTSSQALRSIRQHHKSINCIKTLIALLH